MTIGSTRSSSRRGKFVVRAILVAALAAPSVARADAAYDSLFTAWKARRYAEVAEPLLEYRERPYGRCAQVDYLIATSLCRMSGFESEGHNFFGLVLSYNLDLSSRRLVQHEMDQCAVAEAPAPLVLATPRRVAGVQFHGKMYHLASPPAGMPMSADLAEVVRPLDSRELDDRLFVPAAGDSAVSKVRRLVGAGASVRAFSHFVFADLAGHSPAQLDTLSRRLDHVLDLFVTGFGMPRPEHLIAVYLTRDAGQLRDLALRLHGIKVSQFSIGYSIQDDLSIVGVIPGQTYGTLCHEMFHLLVRSHFGDVPPWMDEGLAALYEVAVVSDTAIRGAPNWRGKILRAFGANRPALRKLVSMEWRTFDQSGGDENLQALNHATARYFMLYLQERGRLVEVYRSFRERDVRKLKLPLAEDGIARIEAVVGQPMAAIESDFDGWCHAVLAASPE